ncbi:hypothetical protein CDD81_6703 [Ophiocordyceps australis]|uniref:DUF1479 domain protein n=1 Tax=Ophiocordyceps australis TaxID=1399860 RepID=A0A2C5Y7H7_9HYPO|nr:hypothetical protein CDD81_6703 [Ophiocordyceps australis]
MFRLALRSRGSFAHPFCRAASTATTASPKKQGNISDSFWSFSGSERPSLPDRFRQLKLDLIQGYEEDLVESWATLLQRLNKENAEVAEKECNVIPQIEFQHLGRDCQELKSEILKRGVVLVRGVIPEPEARAYKEQIEEYIRQNPHTKAFPPNNPQVFELYWSEAQLKARSHPNLIKLQRHLLTSFWKTWSASTHISLNNPITYADRLRIRQPGDSSFALGPHVDGGSVERWEKEGYGKGGVYDKIFQGKWNEYDAWDASGRVDAVNNLYDGLGACSMFRPWQGWLSISHSGPRQGTLLVNPLMHMTTPYILLRPFFEPLRAGKGPDFLDKSNWRFTASSRMTSELQGATPGHGLELNDHEHPHLELKSTMVHIPEIKPGDFVAWHCDTIHAVDKQHQGTSDSSVLYIPVCPVTTLNAEYLVRQRDAFRKGTPGPDFPGGEGESQHVGRPTEEAFRQWTTAQGRQAFGLDRLEAVSKATAGERGAIERANSILGF